MPYFYYVIDRLGALKTSKHKTRAAAEKKARNNDRLKIKEVFEADKPKRKRII